MATEKHGAPGHANSDAPTGDKLARTLPSAVEARHSAISQPDTNGTWCGKYRYVGVAKGDGTLCEYGFPCKSWYCRECSSDRAAAVQRQAANYFNQAGGVWLLQREVGVTWDETRERPIPNYGAARESVKNKVKGTGAGWLWLATSDGWFYAFAESDISLRKYGEREAIDAIRLDPSTAARLIEHVARPGVVVKNSDRRGKWGLGNPLEKRGADEESKHYGVGRHHGDRDLRKIQRLAVRLAYRDGRISARQARRARAAADGEARSWLPPPRGLEAEEWHSYVELAWQREGAWGVIKSPSMSETPGVPEAA